MCTKVAKVNGRIQVTALGVTQIEAHELGAQTSRCESVNGFMGEEYVNIYIYINKTRQKFNTTKPGLMKEGIGFGSSLYRKKHGLVCHAVTFVFLAWV